MRRRLKRGANESESTGKSGQEIPVDQPAALQPSYPDSAPVAAAEPAFAAAEEAGLEPDHAPAPEPKLVVETEQPPDTPPTPLPEAQTKAPRGYVVLSIGLPGSGKTTWHRRRGVAPLSSDILRRILFDDVAEQRFQGLVFSSLRSLLRARLIARMPWNYVDATNLSLHERRQWIKMAKGFGYEVHAVFFDVPLAVCLERNRKREPVVPDEVILKMNERLKPPNFKEGFDKITVVRVKGQPGAEPTAAAADAEAPASADKPQ